MDFDEAKDEYEKIPIPEELSQRVEMAIKEAQKNKNTINMPKERSAMKKNH